MITEKILLHSPLFRNVSPEDLPSVLRLMNATRTTYKKKQMISDDIFPRCGIVIDGTISMQYFTENTDVTRLINIHSGQTFGAAFALSGIQKPPIRLMAVSDCDVLLLNFKALLEPEASTNPVCTIVYQNLIQLLAKRLIALQYKSRILAQKSIRDKLMVYLSYLPKDENGIMTVPFSKTDLSEYLSVNRTALAREIRRLQEEGILKWDGRKVQFMNWQN